MTNAELFIEKFKQLENIIRLKFGLEDYDSAVVALVKRPQFRALKDDLNYIREIRNFLQHKPKIDGQYPIEPSDQLIKTIDSTINRLENPPRVFDKCIKIANICAAQKENKIFPYMQQMKERGFSHVPILEDGVVCGVFSENTLFACLIEDELIYDKNHTIFSDELISKYCQLNGHVSEYFDFVKKDCFIEDAKEMFRQCFNGQKRLAALFVTEHGKSSEKLLGMLTPWDVLL